MDNCSSPTPPAARWRSRRAASARSLRPRSEQPLLDILDIRVWIDRECPEHTSGVHPVATLTGIRSVIQRHTPLPPWDIGVDHPQVVTDICRRLDLVEEVHEALRVAVHVMEIEVRGNPGHLVLKLIVEALCDRE